MYLLRRVLFLSAALRFGLFAGGGGSATPSGISAQSAAPDLTSHFVFHPLAIHPNAGTPPVLMNFVADGPNQGGVPCIDCVNGASSGDNVGMTGPSSYTFPRTSFGSMRYRLRTFPIKESARLRGRSLPARKRSIVWRHANAPERGWFRALCGCSQSSEILRARRLDRKVCLREKLRLGSRAASVRVARRLGRSVFVADDHLGDEVVEEAGCDDAVDFA